MRLKSCFWGSNPESLYAVFHCVLLPSTSLNQYPHILDQYPPLHKKVSPTFELAPLQANFHPTACIELYPPPVDPFQLHCGHISTSLQTSIQPPVECRPISTPLYCRPVATQCTVQQKTSIQLLQTRKHPWSIHTMNISHKSIKKRSRAGGRRLPVPRPPP